MQILSISPAEGIIIGKETKRKIQKKLPQFQSLQEQDEEGTNQIDKLNTPNEQEILNTHRQKKQIQLNESVLIIIIIAVVLALLAVLVIKINTQVIKQQVDIQDTIVDQKKVDLSIKDLVEKITKVHSEIERVTAAQLALNNKLIQFQKQKIAGKTSQLVKMRRQKFQTTQDQKSKYLEILDSSIQALLSELIKGQRQLLKLNKAQKDLMGKLVTAYEQNSQVKILNSKINELKDRFVEREVQRIKSGYIKSINKDSLTSTNNDQDKQSLDNKLNKPSSDLSRLNNQKTKRNLYQQDRPRNNLQQFEDVQQVFSQQKQF